MIFSLAQAAPQPSPVLVNPVTSPVVPQTDVLAVIAVLIFNAVPRWFELVKQNREKQNQLMQQVSEELGKRYVEAQQDRLEISQRLEDMSVVMERLIEKNNEKTDALSDTLSRVFVVRKNQE